MFRWRHMKRLFALGSCAAGVGCASVVVYRVRKLQNAGIIHASAETEDLNKNYPDQTPLPTRADILKRLKSDKFDILIIGGGATGAGVALDSQTRGLNTALVEMNDYAGATSSKSTKMIHGGMRYLQAALMGFDREQFNMVYEGLSERANMIAVAPHLSYPLPILLPVKDWWMIPYFWAGVVTYDLISATQRLAPSYFISRKKSLKKFPMLSTDVAGALVYYDGGQDDARTCLSVVLSAVRFGAACSNHVAVTQLVKEVDAKTKTAVITGVKCKDLISGEVFTVSAKCVVNATGPFTDVIRLLDNAAVTPICEPSLGVHITLPGYFTPPDMGLLDPATSDGRVVFLLPWQGYTIAGTTDEKCTLENGQKPTEAGIQFILREIKSQLRSDLVIRRGDVLSAWSGIRPLVKDPNAKDTKSLARNHIIEVSTSKMITIAGGKWTTYRKMAEETVDRAVTVCDLKPSKSAKSRTFGLLIEGGHKYTDTLFVKLMQEYGLSQDTAEHLAHQYGDKAFEVARLCGLTGYKSPMVGNRIHPNHPYLDGEITYAVEREYALTAVDVIARRLRFAFINVDTANESLETVVNIMAKSLKWDKKKVAQEIAEAREFLRREMGLNLANASWKPGQRDLSQDEEMRYSKVFDVIDKDKRGYLTSNDVKRMFSDHKDICDHVPADKLTEIVNEVEVSDKGQMKREDFLNLMYRLKTGTTNSQRFAMAAKLLAEAPSR